MRDPAEIAAMRDRVYARSLAHHADYTSAVLDVLDWVINPVEPDSLVLDLADSDHDCPPAFCECED